MPPPEQRDPPHPPVAGFAPQPPVQPPMVGTESHPPELHPPSHPPEPHESQAVNPTCMIPPGPKACSGGTIPAGVTKPLAS